MLGPFPRLWGDAMRSVMDNQTMEDRRPDVSHVNLPVEGVGHSSLLEGNKTSYFGLDKAALRLPLQRRQIAQTKRRLARMM